MIEMGVPVADAPSFLRKLARTQRFTLGIPKQFQVSSDGGHVLFVRSADGYARMHNLWSVDLVTSGENLVVDTAQLLPDEEQLSADEQARRERSREAGGGVVGYSTDAECGLAAFVLGGRLYTVDIATRSITEQATAGDEGIVDPKMNSQGTHLAYVTGGAVRVISLADERDTELIADAQPHVSWGVAEFIAAEELGRSSGYWWSPGGQYVLAQRSDSSQVPRWSITDPANPDAAVHTVSYPAAGADNVAVSMAIIGLDGSFVPVHAGQWWEYLVSVHWSEGGPPLITVQSRDQRRVDVLAIDITDGSTTVLHTETDPEWVEPAAGVPAWTTDGQLVRIGVEAGAYRLFIDGTPVTDPGMQVRSVLHVGSDVLFNASEEDPTQIHVYRTQAGSARRISEVDGVHIGAGTADTTVLATWSLAYSGPAVTVVRADGSQTRIGSYPADPGLDLNLRLLTAGERELRAALVLPSHYHTGDGPLPVLLDPYGGPHAQRVLATRNAYLSCQWLADQGFAVLVIDGRGTPGRGPGWEKEISGQLAEITVTDQADALHALAAQRRELDTGRVAIRGWSYGGYLAAAAVLRRPDIFHAAIAGAPVVDWSLYDTHYTERYLGHPEHEPETYRRNSLTTEAANLQRPLLIAHGLADDNVFVAHALRLSAALLAAGRRHVFLPLVGMTHMTPQAEDIAENLLCMQVDWLKQELGIAETRHQEGIHG